MPHKMYNVRPGDTLGAIAKWSNVTYPTLIALNPQIENPNLIFPGDTILLPETATRTGTLNAAAKEVFTGSEPQWLKIAQREIGTKEKPGNNPRILEYLATTTLSKKDKGSDQTSWCAAFVNWCLETAGKKGLGSAWALDWAKLGKAVDPPTPGCVVVFSRESAKVSGGHVGFFISDLGTKVELLGGNQGDAVSIDSYPKSGKKGPYFYTLKAYRTP